MYVDDILITGSDSAAIQLLKHNLHAAFGIKDLGLLHYFLGFEVSHLPEGVTLTQRKFTQDLLKHSGFLHSKPTATPLPLNCKLSATEGVPLEDPSEYRTYVGKLNFLSNTRLDICFAVQILSQYMQHPTFSHMAALQHLLKYLSGTSGQGILLKGIDQLQLSAFSDLDWAFVLLVGGQCQVMLCSLISPLSVGSPRSKALWPGILLKLNTVPWHMLLLRLNG